MTHNPHPLPPAVVNRLDRLYDAWMAAEQFHQAAEILHGAANTIASLAGLEIAEERVQAARCAYDAALAEAAGSTAPVAESA